MQPELAPEPFHRPGWVYEEKLDGWRMIAYKDGPRVRLVSRTGVDHTARFPEIAAAVAGLLAPQLILDGEVCVFDDQLVSQLHLLGWGGTDAAAVQTPPVFMAFDCLHEAWPGSAPAAPGRAPSRAGGRDHGAGSDLPGASAPRPRA
jgi:bifunctional non-homologous end joining protein LigD